MGLMCYYLKKMVKNVLYVKKYLLWHIGIICNLKIMKRKLHSSSTVLSVLQAKYFYIFIIFIFIFINIIIIFLKKIKQVAKLTHRANP